MSLNSWWMSDQNISSHVSSKILHSGFKSSRIPLNPCKNSNTVLKILKFPEFNLTMIFGNTGQYFANKRLGDAVWSVSVWLSWSGLLQPANCRFLRVPTCIREVNNRGKLAKSKKCMVASFYHVRTNVFLRWCLKKIAGF